MSIMHYDRTYCPQCGKLASDIPVIVTTSGKLCCHECRVPLVHPLRGPFRFLDVEEECDGYSASLCLCRPEVPAV